MGILNEDKLDRLNGMMDTVGNTVHPTKSNRVLFEKAGFDGNRYAIIQESSKDFVVKKTNKEGILIAEDYNYIDGVQNKMKNSFGQYQKALRKLNTMFGEQRRAAKSTESFRLFENLEEKFVIKTDAPEEEPVDDTSFDSNDQEESGDDFEMEPDMENDTEDFDGAEEEADPKTRIQKLSGKLGYELGEFEAEGEDENEYSDLAKYAVKSVLSRLKADQISEEDKNDILNSVTGALNPPEEEGEETEGGSAEDPTNVDTGEEEVADDGGLGEAMDSLREEKDPNEATDGNNSFSEKPAAAPKDALHDDTNAPKTKVKVEDHKGDPNEAKNGEEAPFNDNPTSTQDKLGNDVNVPSGAVDVPFKGETKDPNETEGKDAKKPYTQSVKKITEAYTIDEIMEEFYEEDMYEDNSSDPAGPQKKNYNEMPIFNAKNPFPKGAKVELDEYIVAHASDKEGEVPFNYGDKKWEYVWGLYPVTVDGEQVGWKKDIAVYEIGGSDFTYGYNNFRETHNMDGYTEESNRELGESEESCGCNDSDQNMLNDLETEGTNTKKKKTDLYGIPMDFYDDGVYDIDIPNDVIGGELGGDFGGVGENEEMPSPMPNREEEEMPSPRNNSNVEIEGGKGMSAIMPVHNPFAIVRGR